MGRVLSSLDMIQFPHSDSWIRGFTFSLAWDKKGTESRQLGTTERACRNRGEGESPNYFHILFDLHFWLTITGVDSFWRFGKSAANASSVIDLGGYKERLRQGNPTQRPMFTSFYENWCVWSDGAKHKTDQVIFATGFRSNLAFLQEIGRITSTGEAIQEGGISTAVSGMYRGVIRPEDICLGYLARGGTWCILCRKSYSPEDEKHTERLRTAPGSDRYALTSYNTKLRIRMADNNIYVAEKWLNRKRD